MSDHYGDDPMRDSVFKGVQDAVIALDDIALPGPAERRRRELLRTATAIYCTCKITVAYGTEDAVDYATDTAFKLLESIERIEAAK